MPTKIHLALTRVPDLCRAHMTLAPPALGHGWPAFTQGREPRGSSVKCSELSDSCACPKKRKKNHKPREVCDLLLQEQKWKVIK